MTPASEKPVFDGATLSPRLKTQKADAIAMPIGKPQQADGAAVARAYKHAAGKSSTYDPHVVDMIYHMSRHGTFDDQYVADFVAAKLGGERKQPAREALATWDQLVFLSANLTRLVIDPYREKCNSQVTIGSRRPRPMVLHWPIVFDGVDYARLPGALPSYLVQAAKKATLASCVQDEYPITSDDLQDKRIRTVDLETAPGELPGACAIQLSAAHASQLTKEKVASAFDRVQKKTDGQIPIGIVAPACNAGDVIDRTIDLNVDYYVADAQWMQDARPSEVFAELAAPPALGVLTDVVERLRCHCREAEIDVIYRGGIRGGADAGKALCLGASAVALGLSAIVAMGFKLTRIDGQAHLMEQLADHLDEQEAIGRVYNFAKSVNMEVTMLARACGKSSVMNMEPEDLRALTIAVSAATGIAVAGKDYVFRQS